MWFIMTSTTMKGKRIFSVPGSGATDWRVLASQHWKNSLEFSTS